MTAEHFRFMDLPAELRLMVYEFIPFTTRYPIIHGKDRYNKHDKPPSKAMLVAKSLSCSVLGTCRTVRKEASSIFSSKFEILRSEPTRFIVQYDALRLFAVLYDIIDSACFYEQAEMAEEFADRFEVDICVLRRFFDEASLSLSRSATLAGGPRIVVVLYDSLSYGTHMKEVMERLIEKISEDCIEMCDGKVSLSIMVSSRPGTSSSSSFASHEHLQDWCGKQSSVYKPIGPLKTQEWAKHWQESE